MGVQLKLDLNRPIQQNFMGNNAVYHGYAGMPDDAGRVYSEELCELEAIALPPWVFGLCAPFTSGTLGTPKSRYGTGKAKKCRRFTVG